MKGNQSYGVSPNKGRNEQRAQEGIYDEVEIPELHTYKKTSKSEHVQSSRQEKWHCGHNVLWGIMATIVVVLIAILASITLIVASMDFQALRDFQVACPELHEVENGSTTITPGLVHRGIGSKVDYSCDQGYVLVGIATRHCVYRYYREMLGFWNGSAPSCRVRCPLLDPVDHGSMILSSRNIAPVIATYSCQNGYLLIGPKQRECVYSSGEEIGQWSGIMPSCRIGSLIDCNQSNCRLTTVDCRYRQGYCSISCNSSMPFSCHQASFDCPQRGSGCYINCTSEYQYECLGTNTLCGESGDCIVDCLGRYSCQYSNFSCSINGQSRMNCAGQQACQYSRFTCSEGYSGKSSLVHCSGSSSCNSATLSNTQQIKCSGSSSCYYASLSNAHQLECSGFFSCYYAGLLNAEELLNCSGSSSCQSVNNISTEQLHCSGNSACINSRGDLSATSMNCSGSSSCRSSTFEIGQVNCNGASSCSSSTINCPSNSMACDVSCSGINSCQFLNIYCPNDADCNVHCNNRGSCNNARIYCPTGNYFCNIHCSNPLSCASLQITNSQNVNLRCCGDRSCVGANVSPTSTTNCIYTI